jgi:hypothetical protein
MINNKKIGRKDDTNSKDGSEAKDGINAKLGSRVKRFSLNLTSLFFGIRLKKSVTFYIFKMYNTNALLTFRL